jgi:hypothetical protein
VDNCVEFWDMLRKCLEVADTIHDPNFRAQALSRFSACTINSMDILTRYE